jgi:hypothetical protein
MFLASRLRSATVRPVMDFAWAKAKQSVILFLSAFAFKIELLIFFDCCEDCWGQR